MLWAEHTFSQKVRERDTILWSFSIISAYIPYLFCGVHRERVCVNELKLSISINFNRIVILANYFRNGLPDMCSRQPKISSDVHSRDIAHNWNDKRWYICALASGSIADVDTHENGTFATHTLTHKSNTNLECWLTALYNFTAKTLYSAHSHTTGLHFGKVLLKKTELSHAETQFVMHSVEQQRFAFHCGSSASGSRCLREFGIVHWLYAPAPMVRRSQHSLVVLWSYEYCRYIVFLDHICSKYKWSLKLSS